MNFPEPELLMVLVAFQESKNLIEAAKRLKISQPAVTQRLQRLQDQVSYPLYAFEGRKKVLTLYGKNLYEMAQTQFKNLEIAFEQVNRRFAMPEHLVLRIGGQIELVEHFSAIVNFPGRTDHRKMLDSEAIDALQKESIDVAITQTIIDNSELASRKFFESSAHFITHRKHSKIINGFKDIQNSPQKLMKINCAFHRLERSYKELFCQGLEIEPSEFNEKATFEDWRSLLNFVENGGGFSIVPGFIQSQSKDIISFDIPHSILPRSNYYAVFQRKLRKIDSFKSVVNFEMRTS